jgi:hypothetical protein
VQFLFDIIHISSLARLFVSFVCYVLYVPSHSPVRKNDTLKKFKKPTSVMDIFGNGNDSTSAADSTTPAEPTHTLGDAARHRRQLSAVVEQPEPAPRANVGLFDVSEDQAIEEEPEADANSVEATEYTELADQRFTNRSMLFTLSLLLVVYIYFFVYIYIFFFD